MKFIDLIQSYNWLSVDLILLRLYPGQETRVDAYRNVFEFLKLLEPEESYLSIVLTENNGDPDDKSKEISCVDISGRKKEKKPDAITDSYAIEFMEWKKWLGMDLAPETTKLFTDLEIIVHCLYEMTFFGFNEKEIEEQFNAIKESAKEYKNWTKLRERKK